MISPEIPEPTKKVLKAPPRRNLEDIKKASIPKAKPKLKANPRSIELLSKEFKPRLIIIQISIQSFIRYTNSIK